MGIGARLREERERLGLNQEGFGQLGGVRKQAPQVRITPGLMNVWYLQVDGLNTRAKVQRIK